MDRQQIIDCLRKNERSLRERGVTRAALFGSRARGDNKPDSDIDITVEIGPNAPIGLFDYVSIVHSIEAPFPVRVDVSDRMAMKAYVRPSAERDAIYAF